MEQVPAWASLWSVREGDELLAVQHALANQLAAASGAGTYGVLRESPLPTEGRFLLGEYEQGPVATSDPEAIEREVQKELTVARRRSGPNKTARKPATSLLSQCSTGGLVLARGAVIVARVADVISIQQCLVKTKRAFSSGLYDEAVSELAPFIATALSHTDAQAHPSKSLSAEVVGGLLQHSLQAAHVNEQNTEQFMKLYRQLLDKARAYLLVAIKDREVSDVRLFIIVLVALGCKQEAIVHFQAFVKEEIQACCTAHSSGSTGADLEQTERVIVSVMDAAASLLMDLDAVASALFFPQSLSDALVRARGEEVVEDIGNEDDVLDYVQMGESTSQKLAIGSVPLRGQARVSLLSAVQDVVDPFFISLVSSTLAESNAWSLVAGLDTPLDVSLLPLERVFSENEAELCQPPVVDTFLRGLSPLLARMRAWLAFVRRTASTPEVPIDASWIARCEAVVGSSRSHELLSDLSKLECHLLKLYLRLSSQSILTEPFLTPGEDSKQPFAPFVDELYFVVNCVAGHAVTSCCPDIIVQCCADAAGLITGGLGGSLVDMLERLSMCDASLLEGRVLEVIAQSEWYCPSAAPTGSLKSVAQSGAEKLWQRVLSMKESAKVVQQTKLSVLWKDIARGRKVALRGQPPADAPEAASPREREVGLDWSAKMCGVVNTLTTAVRFGSELSNNLKRQLQFPASPHVCSFSRAELSFMIEHGVQHIVMGMESVLNPLVGSAMVPVVWFWVANVMKALEPAGIGTGNYCRDSEASLDDCHYEWYEDLEALLREGCDGLLPDSMARVLEALCSELVQELEAVLLAQGAVYNESGARLIGTVLDSVADCLVNAGASVSLVYTKFFRLQTVTNAMTCRSEADVRQWAETRSREVHELGEAEHGASIPPAYLLELWRQHRR